MGIHVNKIRGISDELVTKLSEHGFYTTDQLLETVKTASGRKSLAKQLGVNSKVTLELANRADLARVQGIGGAFSDLLEHAGVDTVKELATRRPDNLYAKLAETNAQKQLVGRLPTRKAVEDWVTQAKQLPRVIEY
jgi:predicted flap endonuclease-1-like 5' DNA nuclease